VPKDWHKGDASIHHRQKCYPASHEAEDSVIDIEQIDEKASKEE
jgi:hypothetical protein